MENSTTQTFTSSRKKHDHTFYTQWRVTTSPGELTEAHKASRWYAAFGSDITKVERVSVQSEMLLEGRPAKTEADWADHAKAIRPSIYTVVHTRYGNACIVDYQNDYSDVAGVIVSRPRGKAKSLTLGTWKKYGSKRGHGMAWLRAMAGQKFCTSPDSGRDICPAEAYNRLSEGVWPSRAAIAQGHQAVAL